MKPKTYTHPDVLTAGVQDAHLHEYDRLKEEQRSRIEHRDRLLYTVLAVYGALGWAALRGHPTAWLAAPFVALVLGGLYLATDAKVSAIGRYIRTDLAPRISADAFGWECWYRRDARRRDWKDLWFALNLTLFVALPTGALIQYWISGPHTVGLILISLIGAAAPIVLTRLIRIHTGPASTISTQALIAKTRLLRRR
jgi:hypothetical protein